VAAFRSPVCFMNFWADFLPTSLLYISVLLPSPSLSLPLSLALSISRSHTYTHAGSPCSNWRRLKKASSTCPKSGRRIRDVCVSVCMCVREIVCVSGSVSGRRTRDVCVCVCVCERERERERERDECLCVLVCPPKIWRSRRDLSLSLSLSICTRVCLRVFKVWESRDLKTETNDTHTHTRCV